MTAEQKSHKATTAVIILIIGALLVGTILFITNNDRRTLNTDRQIDDSILTEDSAQNTDSVVPSDTLQ